MIKLIFAVLYVSLNDGPYTFLYKTAVYYIYVQTTQTKWIIKR